MVQLSRSRIKERVEYPSRGGLWTRCRVLHEPVETATWRRSHELGHTTTHLINHTPHQPHTSSTTHLINHITRLSHSHTPMRRIWTATRPHSLLRSRGRRQTHNATQRATLQRALARARLQRRRLPRHARKGSDI